MNEAVEHDVHDAAENDVLDGDDHIILMKATRVATGDLCFFQVTRFVRPGKQRRISFGSSA